MKRPIGFWKPHDEYICWGIIYTPSTVRMNYEVKYNNKFPPDSYYCPQGIEIWNEALSGEYENASAVVNFTPKGKAIKLDLIGYAPDYSRAVLIDGVTYLTANGSVVVSVTPNITHTLTFLIDPTAEAYLFPDSTRLVAYCIGG